jgi:mono/diheme cytochrome c family protein
MTPFRNTLAANSWATSPGAAAARRVAAAFGVAAALGIALGPSPAHSAADGAALFTQNCALCHQSGATGLAGQFPRLAGRVGPISRTPRGRAYLIDVLTYGMAGQVVVDGQTIIGVMPALALDDESVAAVLVYLQSLGRPSPKPFTSGEVAAQRAQPHKTAGDVHAERMSLAQAKLLE